MVDAVKRAVTTSHLGDAYPGRGVREESKKAPGAGGARVSSWSEGKEAEYLREQHDSVHQQDISNHISESATSEGWADRGTIPKLY